MKEGPIKENPTNNQLVISALQKQCDCANTVKRGPSCVYVCNKNKIMRTEKMTFYDLDTISYVMKILVPLIGKYL